MNDLCALQPEIAPDIDGIFYPLGRGSLPVFVYQLRPSALQRAGEARPTAAANKNLVPRREEIH